MKTSKMKEILKQAGKRVAPAWPLKNFVAVNPYSGFTDTHFSETAQKLVERGHIKMTMSLDFYLDQLKDGKITFADLKKAMTKCEREEDSVEEFLGTVRKWSDQKTQPKWIGNSLTDIATEITGKNWNEQLVDRVSSWASGYFDQTIAAWNNGDSRVNLFKAWKQEAEIDRSNEIMGLKGFRAALSELPENHLTFINNFIEQLKLEDEDIESYLHGVLLKTIGWSSYISGIDFNNGIYKGSTQNLEEFLAILLAWESYFMNHCEEKEAIKAHWFKQLHIKSSDNDSLKELAALELVMQEAMDIAHQRELRKAFKAHTPDQTEHKPNAQMVFCIDVRSEVYRRNLEMINPTIETVGFAGFFGFPINYIPLGHQEGKNQCPVLIPSSAVIKETVSNDVEAVKIRTSKHQIEKTWKKFKSGAITSFGFVSPLGLTFLPKILANSFGLSRPVDDPRVDGLQKWIDKGRSIDLTGISLEDKITMGASALTAMGIKDKLAPVVLITGHGSTSVNNPHASGLDCGACGGHSGEINALTAQLILNDPEVRRGLSEKGIIIPADTIFVACLHDTTTDEISIVNETLIPETRKEELNGLKKSFSEASAQTRLERAQRFNLDVEASDQIESEVLNRSNDWSQIRPEWGLAGCSAFVIADRSRTKGMNLRGKSFLHDYDWKTDNEFKILEAIMTAPMVVTSWINLQYYASTTDNQHFGAGNKTLHNVTAGIGVLEGSGGDLRIGLPLQSVHNGERFEHLPQRLNVVIDAPVDAINSILEKHESIKQLCDNAWVILHRMDEAGNISETYTQNFEWAADESAQEPTKEKVLQTV